MTRYVCVMPLDTRAAGVMESGDRVIVDVVVTATAVLPMTHASTEFPRNWRVELRRDGETWRVAAVRSAESDLADALAHSDPGTQHALLLDCGAWVSAELVEQLVQQGLAIGRQGQYEREERLGMFALQIAEELGDSRGSGRVHWLLGRARDSQGAYDDAFVHYEKAHDLAVASGDRETEGRALVGRGFVFIHRYEFAKAVEPVQKGLEIALSVGDHLIADNAYLAMSEIHNQSGRYIDALRDLDRAREHAELAGDSVVVAAATANAGILFSTMNNDDLARERLLQGIELYRKIGNVRGEMRNLRNLAEVEASAGNTNAAAEALDRVEDYLKTNPNERLSAFAAVTRAKIAQRRKDLATADREALRALALAEKIKNPYLAAMVTNGLSEIRFEQKKYDEAADLAAKALELSRATGSMVGVDQYMQVNAARAYRKLGKTEDALRALQTAVEEIEAQLPNVPGTEEDQHAFYSNKTAPYYELFALFVDRQEPERALDWVERSRARSLVDFLGRQRVSADRNILSADERKAESALEQDIVVINRKLLELRTDPANQESQLAEVERELREKRRALQTFTTELRIKHPELLLTRGALPRPTLAETQKLIPDDGAIVEYIAMSDAIWVVVLTRTGAPRIVRIDVDYDDLQQRVKKFASRIAQRDLTVDAESRKLYELLFGPIESLVGAKAMLCVIPDADLWHLPFYALVAPDGRYLIERTAVFYAPSRSFLAWYAEHSATSTDRAGLLVLANPRLAEGTTKMARAIQRDESLGPLPNAEHEAHRLEEMYRGATVVTGERATEEFLKRNAARYRIIHLATHAVFDDTFPLYSHMLLATGRGSGEDGVLEAREIMNLDLDADLVVLSSCETGRGRVRGGEGLIGMSWALLVAGCPTAVVSQWKVGSAGTADLMIEFHRRLSRVPANDRRTAAARAMRETQLAHMRNPQYKHPYDWSAFVVIGSGW